MANIKDKIAQIRQAIFGKEVRESIASGIEAINKEVENTTARQDNVEAQFQAVLHETTDKDVISAPEITAARVGANNTTHSNLKARLDAEHNEVVSELAKNTTEHENFKSQLAKKIDEVIFNVSNQSIEFYANNFMINSISVSEAGNAQAVQDYIDRLVADGKIEGVSLADGSVTTSKLARGAVNAGRLSRNFSDRMVLPDQTDLNLVNEAGVYFVNRLFNYTNLPEGITNGILTVEFANVSFMRQTITDIYNPGLSFTRTLRNQNGVVSEVTDWVDLTLERYTTKQNERWVI